MKLKDNCDYFYAICFGKRSIFSIFAAVNVRTKRHIASWLLLAVFVPMVIISSLHIHEEQATEAECADCVQHQCHGHLVQQTVGAHECVLCQFLTLPMIAVAVATLLIFNNVCKTQRPAMLCQFSVAHNGMTGLRSPPYPSA